MSPNGTRLAYNTVQPIGQPAHRQLAVADLVNGTTTVLDKIPSDNVMVARWSSDATRLLFDYYVNNERQIGVVNVDGTGFVGVLDRQQPHRNYGRRHGAPTGSQCSLRTWNRCIDSI